MLLAVKLEKAPELGGGGLDWIGSYIKITFLVFFLTIMFESPSKSVELH